MERMRQALLTFEESEFYRGNKVEDVLLGKANEPLLQKKTVTPFKTCDALAPLNKSQMKAATMAVSHRISLIQGPPGTGKTSTSAAIVYHLASLKQGPILVTAPSNVATDHLAETIAKTGLKVVRVMAKSREDEKSPIEDLCLHRRILKEDPTLKVLDTGEDVKKLRRRYDKFFFRAEMNVLRSADVICCTCMAAGDPRITNANLQFRAILVDEAGQAVEPAVLIPITREAPCIVLVGDHIQLGPVIKSQASINCGYDLSMFQRLIGNGVPSVMLNTQYRMHPSIATFPSCQFYGGRLLNGVEAHQRARKLSYFPWPNSAHPLAFIKSDGPESKYEKGKSYMNAREGTLCVSIVELLLKSGVKPEQIGVVTPYEGQCFHIIDLFNVIIKNHAEKNAIKNDKSVVLKSPYEDVQVASVNAFQGREKDYIIFSCVRSNSGYGIGFLNDPCRLNVALTRPKYGLILVGNPVSLRVDPLWSRLIDHYKSNHFMMDIADLHATSLKIPA